MVFWLVMVAELPEVPVARSKPCAIHVALGWRSDHLLYAQ